MELLFEKSVPGRGCDLLPPLDVPPAHLLEGLERKTPLRLPEMAEVDLSRHYSALCRRTHGVNNGFYPLGSCTMKYNPKINEELAALPGFAGVHPLQSADTVQGCLEVLGWAEELLCEVTGMDQMTFQPAAGAHGEFTALLMVKKYHLDRGDPARTKILVPDSAHGTNPASAAMCGFTVVNVPSNSQGGVDLEALRALPPEAWRPPGRTPPGSCSPTPTPWACSIPIFWRSPGSSTTRGACATTTEPTSTPSWGWPGPATWALIWST